MQTKHDMNHPLNQVPNQPSEAPSTQSTDASSLRRRLLAGSLSAPLALTVTSAMGASRTTFSACLDNARLQPKPDRMMINSLSDPDDWLRVRITIFEISLRDSKGEYAVEPGKYFYGQNRVTMYRLNDANPESGVATRVTKFDGSYPGLKRRILEKRFALAYTNDEGKIVGYGWETNGGAHCKKSCFTSVVAHAKGRARA